MFHDFYSTVIIYSTLCITKKGFTMRIAGLIQDSIVDGTGLRFVVFTQGCKQHCNGCHNPDTWNPDGGTEMTVDKIILEMLGNPLTDGLTLSGGEPFLQAGECAELDIAAKKNRLNVWVYSGFTFETLYAQSQSEQQIRKLLELSDVLIDGQFVLADRTSSLKWRGSKNQRVLDVPKSLEAGEAVLLI